MNKRCLILTMLVTLIGSACDKATTPSEVDAEADRFIMTAEASASFATALEDVRLRVLPGLSAPSGGDQLDSALDAVADALATRQKTALRDALATAEAVMVRLSEHETYESVAADLESVRLILSAATQLLDTKVDAPTF